MTEKFRNSSISARIIWIVGAVLLILLVGQIALVAFNVIEPEEANLRPVVDLTALLVGYLTGRQVEREFGPRPEPPEPTEEGHL